MSAEVNRPAASTRGAQVRGPLLVVVMVVVVVMAALGAWRALKAKPKVGPLTEVLAIDEYYAVFVHDVRDDPRRSFLRLTHVDRGESWGALIPLYDRNARMVGRIATEAGVISVRSETGGVPYLHAFEAAHGKKLGRHLLTDGEAVAGIVPAVGSLFGAGEVFELTAADTGTHLVAVALAEGKTRWRQELGTDLIEAAWLRSGQVVLYRPNGDGGGGRIERLARASGEPIGAALAVEARPCVLDERAYAERDGDIIAISLAQDSGQDKPEVRVLDQLRARVPAAARLTIARSGRACGHHGTSDILAIEFAEVSADGLAERQQRLIWIDRDTLAVRAVLTLPGPLAATADAAVGLRDDALASRPLPRMLPLLLGDRAAEQVVIVDLEQAALVRASVRDPLLAQAHLAITESAGYLWIPGPPAGIPSESSSEFPGSIVARIDGTTGTLDAAVSIAGTAPLRRQQIASGMLWLYRPESSAWVVLDGTSLRARGQGQAAIAYDRAGFDTAEPDSRAPAVRAPMPVIEMRERVAEKLGLP